MLQRFFDADARTIKRRPQIVRRAVECRTQHFGLLLDAVEHVIDGGGELVELIARGFDRQTLRRGRRP